MIIWNPTFSVFVLTFKAKLYLNTINLQEKARYHSNASCSPSAEIPTDPSEVTAEYKL